MAALKVLNASNVGAPWMNDPVPFGMRAMERFETLLKDEWRHTVSLATEARKREKARKILDKER